MLVPMVPQELVEYKGGVLFATLKARTEPLMQKWNLHWGEIKDTQGTGVYTVLPRAATADDLTTVLHTLQAAAKCYQGARANALHLEEVRVGGGTIRVPSVAMDSHDSHGGGWCNAAHCMVAAVLQAPDPTLFTTVHTKAAYAKNPTAKPGTDEDAVEGPFKQWSQGKLKMTLPNLRQYATSLGITSTGGRKSLLKNITAHLAVNVQHAQEANLDWSSSESEVNTDSDEEMA